MADTSPQSMYRYYANQLLIALRSNDEQSSPLGLVGHLSGLADAARQLGLAVPIKAYDISDENRVISGLASTTPVGGYSIVFPNGQDLYGSANGHGWELLVDARSDVIVALEQWLAHVEFLSQSMAEDPGAQSVTTATEVPLEQVVTEIESDNQALSLLRFFTNGISDNRIEKAMQVLAEEITVNEKLTKIHTLIPIPASASAEQIGMLLGVTKQAVLKTSWWIENRKGEKKSEIGLSYTERKKRMKEYEPPKMNDHDE